MTDEIKNPKVMSKNVSRRKVLKGAAATAGAVAGSQVIGAPMIWAQNIRDITLNHTGMSYSVLIDIARQASEDLGFNVEMSVTDHGGLLNRMANEPTALDIADSEIWQTKFYVPQGVTQAVDISKIDLWDKITPIYTEGRFAGAEVSREGDSPFEIMYRESKDATSFHDGPTDWATFMPGVYNADTLGIRPDLIGRPVTSWAELINPEFAGKAAIQTTPTIGIMDAIMALEAAGLQTYGDRGNPTQAELGATIDKLIDSGEVVIQSMWSPAVTAVASQGVDVEYVTLDEGLRGWGNGLALMSHLDGLKLEAAYEYLNWYLSGWMGGFIAKQGYYISVPETAQNFLTDNEWGFFYQGNAATDDITSPTGDKTNSAGDKRDGGSYAARFGSVAVWNNAPDQVEFLVSKWNEFLAA
jgi:putative spermidine/putrescine transport system substrate-binding protein